MQAPSMSDRAVKVRAYLTDKSFGYENWHAAQFSGPPSDNTKPGLLLLFDTEAERDAAFAEPKPDVAKALDWLRRLQANALNIRYVDGEPCPNQELADQCAHAIRVIEGLPHEPQG